MKSGKKKIGKLRRVARQFKRVVEVEERAACGWLTVAVDTSRSEFKLIGLQLGQEFFAGEAEDAVAFQSFFATIK